MRGVCIWWLRWISQSSGMVKWRKDVLPSLKMSNLLFLILRWLSKGHSFSPVVVIFKNGFQERELSDRFTWQGIEPKSLSLVINANLEKFKDCDYQGERIRWGERGMITSCILGMEKIYIRWTKPWGNQVCTSIND